MKVVRFPGWMRLPSKMKKHKRKTREPEELTQYEQELVEYNAYAQQASWRRYLAKDGIDYPWEDPTVRSWELDATDDDDP